MELRILKYFLVVAREENITKAASMLHITQPTLSRQLMQLEEELDVKLFQRSNHKIILTEDGMLLKRRAQELVSLSEKTIQELSHKDGVSLIHPLRNVYIMADVPYASNLKTVMYENKDGVTLKRRS